MVETKRKKSETFESLLRRFNKRIQQSGKLIQAKKVRYMAKPTNKNLKKRLALRRNRLQSQREYEKKLGKLNDDDRRRR